LGQGADSRDQATFREWCRQFAEKHSEFEVGGGK
jgi:hypothetical protein